LPQRGDLAHIALAGRFLAAHYVVPQNRTIGAGAARMYLLARYDSEVVTEVAAGAAIEILDISGEWAWSCLTPEGPSGYIRLAQLAPAES